MNYWKNKRVLVTGGAGFIGSYLVELLIKKGSEVTVADNLCRDSLENLENVKSKIRLLTGNLESYDNCLLATANQEIVFNLAAKVTGIEYNISHHSEMFEKNILLQINPIRAAFKNKVKKFVQVSTACVYPHDSLIPTPESEGDRGEPEPTNSGYGWAKRLGEKEARWYYQQGMECLIVRFFNAFGLRDYYNEQTSHVVPASIRKVLSGENITVWGSGNQTRSFIDSRDIVKGLLLLTEKYSKSDPINIGHDKEITIKELIDKIQKIVGIKNNVVYDTSKPEGYARRAADISKLREITGWSPEISLEQTLTDMINEYKVCLKKHQL